MEPDNLQFWLESGLLALVQRTMVSAQREFHRALTDLRRLQKDRGFVPQPTAPSDAEPEHAAPEIGFVPSNTPKPSPGTILIDPHSEDFFRVTGFRTPEELKAHCRNRVANNFEAA